MKLQSIIDKMIEGLKYKKYDWIVWVDSDVIILNPNYKIETFLPDKKMSKIHLIAAYDYLGRKDYCCGLNAGVLFFRVHEWSLSLLMRAISYPYFHKKELIQFDDQTSLNNVLIETNEEEHYIITPPEWFNSQQAIKGNFLNHIMGGNLNYKNRKLNKFIEDSNNDDEWYAKTNEKMRKEVLEYYHKSKNEQIKIILQP
ncbi:hypothetical protein BCR36DRAFT_463805 [Piromyces finnis]|uniref:Galactosyl transferase n=1 Tax=Piromyces finnis TaxID=1754191 RepID=A0A1Y1UWI4_9FUNG|nr:hypothetical protein BCR36DRAFT_463805 [Piromyces finnis]|eukprot:ORX42330.1 hypothetical protein BCR36DRAFT_463805 [Piromyces finnis]